MKLTDFDYELPPQLIAQQPAQRRRDSRLLLLDRETGEIEGRGFADFPSLLRAGDVLVLNDTQVVPARLLGHKSTGGRIEVLIERALEGGRVLAQVRASKSPRAGQVLSIDGAPDQRVEVIGRQGPFLELRLAGVDDVYAWLERVGHVPLPPYIERADEPADQARYQTVYAARPGAVAAPTAGLHFDRSMLADIESAGVDVQTLTLHVGAGTFQPVRCEDVDDHVMHSECFEIGQALCDAVERAHATGGRVVAVGTTVVRALESAAATGELRAASGETEIFIYPGYRFQVVDALLTNFHLPRSTLLMLVSAFAGREQVLRAYRHAVAQRYRFFSYGDAMFIAAAAG